MIGASTRVEPTRAAERPGPTVVEVFADVVCPFTHLGLRRFVERREEEGRPDVVLRVRAWPLELVDHAALDAAFVAEEVDVLRRTVAPDLFTGFDVQAFPRSSLPALRVAAAAARAGTDIGERVALDLREALFEEGIDISRRPALAAIEAAHALNVLPEDTTAVVDDLEEGRRRGVIGSPHFFTPGGDFFCPALDLRRSPDGHLQVQADPAGFDRFLAACFADD